MRKDDKYLVQAWHAILCRAELEKCKFSRKMVTFITSSYVFLDLKSQKCLSNCIIYEVKMSQYSFGRSLIHTIYLFPFHSLSVAQSPASPRRSPRKPPVAGSSSGAIPAASPAIPATSPAVATSSMLASLVLSPGSRVTVMGPVPNNNALLKGYGFLITSRSGPRKRLVLGRSPSESTDESTFEGTMSMKYGFTT